MGTSPRFGHFIDMVDPLQVATVAAQMVRVYGRHADLACERMIDGAEGEPGGVWPKILEAIRKQQSLPTAGAR